MWNFRKFSFFLSLVHFKACIWVLFIDTDALLVGFMHDYLSCRMDNGIPSEQTRAEDIATKDWWVYNCSWGRRGTGGFLSSVYLINPHSSTSWVLTNRSHVQWFKTNMHKCMLIVCACIPYVYLLTICLCLFLVSACIEWNINCMWVLAFWLADVCVGCYIFFFFFSMNNYLLIDMCLDDLWLYISFYWTNLCLHLADVCVGCYIIFSPFWMNNYLLIDMYLNDLWLSIFLYWTNSCFHFTTTSMITLLARCS